MYYFFKILISIILIIILIIYNNKLYLHFSNEIEMSPKLSKQDILDLKKGQKIMTTMLKEFDRICRKHNLKYWCRGGTLIGAIRHKGWIPWDGDIDVGMLESDYNKLEKIIQSELPKDMWFQTHKNDKYWPNKNINKIKSLDAYYKRKEGDGRDKWHNGIQLDIMKFKYINNDTEIYGSTTICGPPDKTKRNKHDIFPLKEIKFDNIDVYVPNKYKQISIEIWGGHPPSLPNINKRYPHEGRIKFSTSMTIKKKYPELYPKF